MGDRPARESLIRARSITRLLLLAAAVAVLVTACGGGAGSSSSATLRIHAGTVEVQSSSAGSFTAGEDGQALRAGATVRTGADGRASVEWPDGSVTRLDTSTTFAIDSLRSGGGLSSGTVIEASQDTGNTYSRVEELSESGDRFSIETPTATAAVQGTTYAIFTESDGTSLVVVTDGAVLVTSSTGEQVLVEAGSMAVVNPDGSIDGPFPTPAGILGGEWIQYNESCDGGTCPVDFGSGAVEHIEIVPDEATINLGESQTYVAEGFDASGGSVGPVAASFAIDGEPCDGSICTPESSGDFVVTAEFNGLTDSGTLIVLATGDIQVTLDWEAFVDLDLWVTDPNGETIKWDTPTSSSGGRLDRDAYGDCTTDDSPPENTVWDETAPPGEYLVTVHVWDICGESSVEFKLEVRVGGVVVLSETGVLTGTGETYETSFSKS